MRHTFETHANEPNFKVTCTIDGCCQTFQRYKSFTSHLLRKHRRDNLYVDDASFVPSNSMITQNSHRETEEAGTMDQAISVDGETTGMSTFRHHEGNILQLKKSAGLFLLSLKERYQLTQAAIDFAISQVQHMISFAVGDLYQILSSLLNEQDIRMPDISEHLDIIRQPFAFLETEYMQLKYYKEVFGLIVSAILYCI